MAEEFLAVDPNLSKTKKYELIIPQLSALLKNENDQIANMANVSAVLRTVFGFFWVGFYRNVNNELVLGPFQGPIACTRIQSGKGVCGQVLLSKKSIIVPDVNKHPGHIACSSLSQSEIVVPRVDENGMVTFVLDIDSDQINDFDEVDKTYLEQLIELV